MQQYRFNDKVQEWHLKNEYPKNGVLANRSIRAAVSCLASIVPKDGTTLENISSIIVREQPPDDPDEWIDRFIQLGLLEEVKTDVT